MQSDHQPSIKCWFWDGIKKPKKVTLLDTQSSLGWLKILKMSAIDYFPPSCGYLVIVDDFYLKD